MSSVLNILPEIVSIIAMIFSLPGNMFILVMILKEWFKNKRLCVTHQLAGGIGFFNILYVGVQVITYIYHKTFTIDAYVHKFALFFVISCNLWFSTWLCVHFCLKTVDINRRVYIYLQTRFHKMLPWILFSSVVWSVLFSIPVNWYTVNESSQDGRHGYSNHNMSLNNTMDGFFDYTLAVNIIGIHVPLILFFSSASTNIIFLCRHMKRVRDNAEGFSLSSVEAHVRAARTITRLLILNIVYLIGGVFFAVVGPKYILLCLTYVLLSVCNILTSFTLIKGNRTLHKALVESFAFCPMYVN